MSTGQTPAVKSVSRGVPRAVNSSDDGRELRASAGVVPSTATAAGPERNAPSTRGARWVASRKKKAIGGGGTSFLPWNQPRRQGGGGGSRYRMSGRTSAAEKGVGGCRSARRSHGIRHS